MVKPISRGIGNRMRGRTTPRRNGSGTISSPSYFESNGPGSVKIKGNVLQIYERYTTLAKEASQSGNDRVYVENLRQHAEHYLRLAREKKEKSNARHATKSNGGGENVSSPSPRRKNRFDQDSIQFYETNHRSKGNLESPEDEDKQGLLDFLGVERDSD